ncbi:MAG: cupin domain-containing protein [Coriobacteriia bacterium]
MFGLGTLLDDDTEVGPAVTWSAHATPVNRLKSLETVSDAGVLDFFSLAAGKTSRHMEPFVIDVAPSSAEAHALSQHEGEESIYVLEAASRSSTARTSTCSVPATVSSTTRPSRMRFVPPVTRRPGSSPSSTTS